jgi:hypothetical protein
MNRLTPFDAGRRVGQAGQHQMNDVVGHVVLAGADEDLLAGDLVGAVGLRLGLGAHQAQVGAAMRLGQAHRAGPLAADHLGQIGLLLLVGAVRVQRGIGAVRQTGVHGPGLVGRVHHLVEALVHHQRQSLAAKLGVGAQRRPAARHILGVGFLEALGRGHRMRHRVERAALAVAADVEREDHIGGKLAGLFQHRVDGVDIDVGMFGHGLEIFRDLEDLVHHELHVTQGGGIAGHVMAPVKMKKSKNQRRVHRRQWRTLAPVRRSAQGCCRNRWWHAPSSRGILRKRAS